MFTALFAVDPLAIFVHELPSQQVIADDHSNHLVGTDCPPSDTQAELLILHAGWNSGWKEFTKLQMLQAMSETKCLQTVECSSEAWLPAGVLPSSQTGPSSKYTTLGSPPYPTP